ncbi:MAG TPA: pilus assembly PilX N-terminal domain-containing protein [Thermoanaerobaculia bacterium]
MRTTQRSPRTLRRRSRDRGSALLVTLIVVAGLSLLGLAFVGVSETESAIAMNQRDGIQTQAIAETGARAVMEWFQNPQWARGLGIMPSNNPAPTGMKRTRLVEGVSDVYKPLPTQFLFDKPYRPARQHRFFGDEETADITINDTIDATTMTNLNTFLFGANSRVAGRITEIRVYAPPIVGGNLVGGFWTSTGQRFGTATIRVQAEKWSAETGGTLRARRIVRLVVGEFPMPIPAGPIQTASNAAFGGSFDVHWGDEVALGTLNPSVSRTRIPWANAFHRPAFERGYDPEVFPIDPPGPGAINTVNYLNELVGKTFQDPWAGSRARGTNSHCGTCGAYANTAIEGQPVHAAFQGQTTTQFPTMRAVTFPTIRYSIWKRIALQGKGTKGVYYFQWADNADGPRFRRNGAGDPKTLAYWVNTIGAGAKLGPGFYFFDTEGGVDPQNTNGTTNTAVLTDGVSWNSSDFGGDFLMSGFIYMNIEEYRSTGAGGAAPANRWYNMPGEIFRDVGHRVWTGSGWEVDAGGTPVLRGAGDGEFSFQDLNGNGKFDVVVNTTPTNFNSFDPGSTPRSAYFVKTWRVAGGCTVPPLSGAPPASACSEPHEPYLNFQYPTASNGTVTVGWEPYATQGRRPRDLVGTSVPDCDATPDKCTSNGYDRDGALVILPVVLHGVLYNEGAYQSQGNVDYFGSVLIRGNASATGNAQIWFDEKLIKDNWAPPGMPRVIVYSSMTDEQ